MSIYPELGQLPLDGLMQRWHKGPEGAKEYAASYYDELVWLLREKGEIGIKFLLSQVGNSDTDQLAAILEMLPPIVPRKTMEKIWERFLDDSRPEIVASTIDGLRKQHSWWIRDRVYALRNHPSHYVRGSVLRYMSQLDRKLASVMLIEALADPHPIVRENAIDELDELGVIHAIPSIKECLTDQNTHVRQAAQTAVENLEELAEDD